METIALQLFSFLSFGLLFCLLLLVGFVNIFFPASTKNIN